jgi:hypothetical protein
MVVSDLTTLAFLATSRTGHHPRLHELVELALIERTPGHSERVSHWRLRPHRMHEADPRHLTRIGYLDRPQHEHDVVAVEATLGTATPTTPHALAVDLQQRLFGALVVTLDPAHDVPFLAAWMERHGTLPGWRAVGDITSAAAGAVQGLLHGWYSAAARLRTLIESPLVDVTAAGELPWSPYRLAAALGVSNICTDASEAPSRARLAAQVWDVLYAPPPRVEQPAPAENRPEPAPQAAEHPYTDDRLVAPRPRRADETAVLDMADIVEAAPRPSTS